MMILLWHVICAVLGLYLAGIFIPGIDFVGNWQTLIIAGSIMGVINALIKPVLKIITFPLKILTLGISSIIINIGLVWLVIGFLFKDHFIITNWLAYIWVFLVIWLLNVILISKK